MKLQIFVLLIVITSCTSSTKNELIRQEVKPGVTEIGRMKDGYKDGAWIFVTSKEQDTFKIEYYKKGIITGLTDIFTGTEFEFKIDNGLKNGQYRAVENGVIIESGYYINDTLNGEQIGYFPNGDINQIINYRMGKFGEFKAFHENGQVKIKSDTFANGKHEFFDQLGEYLYTVNFDKGTPLDTVRNR